MCRRRPAEHWNSALTDAGRLRVTGRGKELGAGELLQSSAESRDNFNTTMTIANCRLMCTPGCGLQGASEQPKCRARTWPSQRRQKFDDRGFGRGSTDGRSSSAEVGAKRKKRKKGS